MKWVSRSTPARWGLGVDAPRATIIGMTAPAAYRTPNVSQTPPREEALKAAGRWGTKRGVRAKTFERAVERVEPIGDLSVTRDATRDSLTGMAVVEAPFDPEAPAGTGPRATPHHRVYYALATGRGSVDVRIDDRGTHVEGDAAPLTRRLGVMFAVLTGGLALTWFAADQYASRHAWFTKQTGAIAVPVLGLVATVACVLFAGEVALGSRARRGSVAVAMLVAAMAAIGASAFAARKYEPTRAHAESAWRSGNTAPALEEAAAFDATHPGTSNEVDALRLMDIPADATLDTLLEEARRPWRSDAARAVVRQRLAVAADARAAELLAEHGGAWRLERLADTVAEWFPERRRQWQGRAALAEARQECFRPMPDALCFERLAERAQDAGIPDADIAAVQHDLGAAARAYVSARFEAAQALEVSSEKISALEYVASVARSIREHLHEDPGIAPDAFAAAIRAARDAGSSPSAAPLQ